MALESVKERTVFHETLQKYKKYHNPSLARLLKFSGYDAVEERSEGVYVYDDRGRRYLDCAGGYGVFVAGHCHPRIVSAVKKQLEMMPLSAKVFFNKPLADLAEILASIAPGELRFSFICNSGAEAVEGALKLARLSTGRPEIISMFNSFHGKTLGALSASGRDMYRDPFKPLVPGFIHVPYGDADALEEAITEGTAAVILEPIQGEGGIIVPSDDYLPRVREICTRRGVLLIADEIQTGLARTGRLFGVDHWQVAPDIMTLGKALGGGVLPVGAFMGTHSVWKCFEHNPLIHTSTFGGNPLACAAAMATIRLIIEKDFAAQATVKGELFKKRLEEVKQAHPGIIREVRGKGLMIGVELAKEGYGGSVIMEMAKAGIIGVYTLNQPKVIRFEPPLVITEDQIEECIEAFELAVSRTEKLFAKS